MKLSLFKYLMSRRSISLSGRDAIFKDLESQEELLTQPFQIKASYNELVKEFINSLKRRLLNHQIDHNLIITNEPFDKALLAFLKKRKRLH
ncbi:MAG: hypothetical protein KatS3mg036_0303 [Ignavibacterium sp.]|nr:MAG: hypothetical protein KatS3mg036_0303 [Ignavibacterium sp.]